MKLVLVGLIGFLTLWTAGCNRQQTAPVKRETGPVEVRVAPVSTRQVERAVESVGTMYPYDEVIVSAQIEGPIAEVNVDLGDLVKEGQVLARISDEEQRYLLAQNEAQLQQSLERLGLKDERDRVKDVRETPEARKAQADLEDAQQRFKRQRELVEQKIGSQQDYDQAESRFKAAVATFDSTLNQTRNQIREVERYKATLDLQRKKLRDTTVRAPFNAFVKDRQATVGKYVQSNTALFTLVKIDPIRLRIEVPERMAPWVKVGQVADVTVEAFGDRVFKGKVWRISPTVDQTKRTFIVEALIANPAGEIKPGSYAKAHLKTNKVEIIHVVPFRGVSYQLGSYKAFVVSGDTITARDVKLGERMNDMVEISDGLVDGENIAVTQLTRLDTGTKVRVAQGPPRDDRKGPAAE
jgi:RND family efflux transporter MFP subunit